MFWASAGVSYTVMTFLDCWAQIVNLMYTNLLSCDFKATQPTTNHVLAGCSVALDQGRYTWRHDSVLQVFVRSLLKDLSPSSKLYADLPGHLASESPPSTIPSNLSTSLSRPDLVLVSPDSITLLELSVVILVPNTTF